MRSPAPDTFPPLLPHPPTSPEILATTPPFTVTLSHGFLPLSPPTLPSAYPAAFKPLVDLLDRMPVQTADGGVGLLGRFELGREVLGLVDLVEEVDKLKVRVKVKKEGKDGKKDKEQQQQQHCRRQHQHQSKAQADAEQNLNDAYEYRPNLQLLGGLYRDYSFLASAYLLEPCHERKCKGEEGYGLGRQRLPACIARPLARIAELTGFKPFMEYAGAYALYNYRLLSPSPTPSDLDPSAALTFDNLSLIRAFEKGLDPESSEAGFVKVHVEMVGVSAGLVRGAVGVLGSFRTGSDGGEAKAEGREEGEGGVGGKEEFDEGLREVVRGLERVNGIMEGMWRKSNPRDYGHFRTFIFGIQSQSMFPHGVVYEAVGAEEPVAFRGESGANDSMIPLCDNLLQIAMPETPLTEILRDFRSYRPGNHREFLEWVRDRAEDVGVRAFALRERGSAALYLQALNQVRDFRWRHWCFTREYILKKTQHPTATGGSPIVVWLPNQLLSVYDQMLEVEKMHGTLPGCEDAMRLVVSQRHTLEKEVQKFCAERDI